MASPVLDAELAASAASATSPTSCDTLEPDATPQIALDPEIEASTSLQLTDDVLRDVMEKRGTRNGRILRETLEAAPYNIKVSYEVVRRRVKKLLDEEKATNSEHTTSDNSSVAKDAAAAAVVRDLDMLADTVRSIVTEVVGAEASLTEEAKDIQNMEEVVEGDDNMVLTETPDGNSEVEPETATADKPANSENNVQVVDITDVVLPANDDEETQDAGDADSAVALPLSNSPEDRSAALATDVNSSKRPAAETKVPKPAPKRQKRAEYSVKTRALCVRRHQTEGASYATISKELGIPHDTVRAIVRKAKRTGSVASAPRSGRPRKTSGIVDKVILEAVRSNRQCSAKAIQEELLRVYGVKLSAETVRRRVLENTKQRIQSISSGTSSDATSSTAVVENRDAAAVAHEATQNLQSLESELTTTDTSLQDSVTFQRLLHGGSQVNSDGERLTSSVVATGPATEVAQSVINSSRLPPPAPADDATVGHEDVPQVQSTTPSQPEDKPLPQKRQKRAEYSIETREECVALHAQGQGFRRIGKALNMPHTTVRAIVEKAQRTGTVLPAKRSGRPRKTDAIVDKVILQAVKTNEKSSARVIKEQLLVAYGVRVSSETIRRRVKDHRRQCMSASTSTANSDVIPVSVPDATLGREQASQEHELLVAAMTSSPSMPAASLMTFDENGVHL